MTKRRKFRRNTTLAAQLRLPEPPPPEPEPLAYHARGLVVPAGAVQDEVEPGEILPFELEEKRNVGVLWFIATDWPENCFCTIVIERGKEAPASADRVSSVMSYDLTTIHERVNVGFPENMSKPATNSQWENYRLCGESYRSFMLAAPFFISQGPWEKVSQTHCLTFSPLGGNRDYMFRYPVGYQIKDGEKVVVRAEYCTPIRRVLKEPKK